jgi:hypothetical protein
MIIIPTRTNIPAYREIVSIEETNFEFEFRWNAREESWTMDIRTELGVDIIAGVKVIPDWDLLGRFTSELLPTGKFLAFDTSGGGLPPGLQDLGDRVQLLYMTEAELAAL